jgi:REP element-mobilizing transposase RayT
LPLSVG